MNPCCGWATWRRDLVAGLVGTAITVAVLVPVGLWKLHTEQDRAAAIEAEAAGVRTKLEKSEADLKAARDAALQAAENARRPFDLFEYARTLQRERQKLDQEKPKPAQQPPDAAKEPQK